MRKLALLIVASLALAIPSAGLTATIQIKITSNGFTPRALTINQGDSVRWTNDDKVNHQLVANNGAFASPIIRPGHTYSFTFNASGRFVYHDALHPSLTGTITVKGAPPQVSLGVSAPIITYGAMTVVSGTVSNQKAGEPVLILAQPYGQSAQQIATLVTGTGGTFTYSAAPVLLTTYTAKWKTATSQTATVQVRPKVTLARSGSRLVAKVIASTSHAGRSVYLQRHSQFGQWVTVSKLKLGPNSGRIFKAPHRLGATTYRVYMTTNQAGTGYLDSWSNSVRIRFRR